MRVSKSWLILALGVVFAANAAAKPAPRDPDAELIGPSFPVGNLNFTVPSRWQIEPVDGPARGNGACRRCAARVMRAKSSPGFFGARRRRHGRGEHHGVDRHHVQPGRSSGGQAMAVQGGRIPVSQVVIFGTYNEAVASPGIPPLARPNYVLLGTVIENFRRQYLLALHRTGGAGHRDAAALQQDDREREGAGHEAGTGAKNSHDFL